MRILKFIMACLGEAEAGHYESLKAEVGEEIRSERAERLARLLVLNGAVE